MIKEKNKLGVIAGILIALVLAVAIGSYVNIKNNIVNKGDVVLKIGYIGPLSGPSAVLGMDAIKAIEIAVEEANEGKNVVEVIAEDDQYITSKTLSSYEKLVNIDKVDVLLVSTYGGVYAIADKAKEDNVVVVDPLDCNSELAKLNDNILCLATETESIGTSLAEYLLKNGEKKTAIMYSTKDNFMAIVKNSFEDAYKKGDGQTKVENYNYDDIDFKTSLLKIKEFNPDALVILGHDEQGMVMKQARDLGIKAQFLTTGTITSPGAQESAKGNAEGTVFAYYDADMNNGIASNFNAKFIAKVGRPAILPLTTYPAYDVVSVLSQKVLSKISINDTKEQRVGKIKKALSGIKNLEGSTGEISVDSDGAAKIKEVVYQLIKGVPELIK